MQARRHFESGGWPCSAQEMYPGHLYKPPLADRQVPRLAEGAAFRLCTSFRTESALKEHVKDHSFLSGLLFSLYGPGQGAKALISHRVHRSGVSTEEEITGHLDHQQTYAIWWPAFLPCTLDGKP